MLQQRASPTMAVLPGQKGWAAKYAARAVAPAPPLASQKRISHGFVDAAQKKISEKNWIWRQIARMRKQNEAKKQQRNKRRSRREANIAGNSGHAMPV
ncbi:MAG: hypothetical protein U1F55_10455 [Chitinivorax sp.]